ncbi:MAG: hypothetical protein O2951_19110 [Bacteroidetes bacterium]|nr:hypothetical protein [Bacteroidota bacterium]
MMVSNNFRYIFATTQKLREMEPGNHGQEYSTHMRTPNSGDRWSQRPGVFIGKPFGL